MIAIIVGSLIAAAIAIYNFINSVFLFIGLISAFVLLNLITDLFPGTHLNYLPPLLGFIYLFCAIAVRIGLDDWILIAVPGIAFFLSIVWFFFGLEAASFLVGISFFLIMPYTCKPLLLPFILNKNENDDFISCTSKTIMLLLTTAPALIGALIVTLEYTLNISNSTKELIIYLSTPAICLFTLAKNINRNELI